MFVELPTGELVNTAQIVRMVPLTGGATRIYFSEGFADYPEDHADIIRKAVTAKPKGRPPKNLTN